MKIEKGVARVLEESGNAVIVLLRVIASTSDGFPPLKGAANAALLITDNISQFHLNQKKWAEFAQYVQKSVACVIQFIPDAKDSRDDLKENLEKLQKTLNRSSDRIRHMRRGSKLMQFWSFTVDPSAIVEMQKELEDVMNLFRLRSMISTELDVAATLELLKDVHLHIQRIEERISDKIVSNAVLSSLSYTEGASWNPTRVCLPETRKILLEDIWQWINSADLNTGAEIYWLADVAGCGKSAVAHTVAQRCYENGLLASSFFFDRETAGRSNPRKLVTTIARDLSILSKELAEKIGTAIEQEPGLVMAQSVSHQFRKLIAEPYKRYPIRKPAVTVIDALDEGFDDELLLILSEEVPKLPGTFRIFLTSRPEENIVSFLSEKKHIRLRGINIHEPENISDIAVYAQVKLQEVARRKHLSAHWPSPELLEKFIQRAGGLFIWVSTVCDYLLHAASPDKKLVRLLADQNLLDVSDIDAEHKMTKLYSTILKTCNWSDREFVEGYYLFMGAIMAAKVPLSKSALQSLHRSQDLQVGDIIHPLAPLFSGSFTPDQPIRILHLSFRDFVTLQARTLPESKIFYIDEKKHSERLAFLCLKVLVEDLTPDIPGAGYISAETRKLSKIPEDSDLNDISEELWYACRFWSDHVVDVKSPVSSQFLDALREFLASRLFPWIGVMTSRKSFQKLSGFRKWLQDTLHEESDLVTNAVNTDLSASLNVLSGCLADHGRREEALKAIEEAVAIQSEFSEAYPSASVGLNLASYSNALSSQLSKMGREEDALEAVREAIASYERAATDYDAHNDHDLATYLNTLSRCLQGMGRSDEALRKIQEAVKLRRRLAENHAEHKFQADLATSLNTLSSQLAKSIRPKEALEAALEAVALRRALAGDGAFASRAHLAISLNTLGARLSKVNGSPNEALEASEEAVKIHRQLAVDQAGNSNKLHLASSLNTFSARLSELNRREEAVEAACEAVEISRMLAAENPEAFSHMLAISLNTFSARLSGVSRHREALRAIHEAVDLRRQQALIRPAAVNPYLSSSLYTLSLRLMDVERFEEALVPAQEALNLRRELAADQPATFTTRVADSLGSISKCYTNMNKPDKALLAAQEEVDLRRKLVPHASSSRFLASLSALSSRLVDLGRHEEARRITEEEQRVKLESADTGPHYFDDA